MSSSLPKRQKLTPDLVNSEDEDSDKFAASKDKSKVSKEVNRSQKNKDNEAFFDIGKKKRVTIRKWQGKCYVDIREFYEDNGEMKPGKKGISLSIEQWEDIKKIINPIDEEISQLNGK